MSVASFIPTVWSARLLQHLDDALIARNFFNQDYEGEISDQGDTVKINQISDVSISTYTPNSDMNTPEELDTTAQELIIDQAKYFNFQVDDVDRVQMRTDLMDAAMQRAGYRLASTEDAFLFNMLATDAGNTIASVSISSPDDAFDLLVQMRTIAQQNNVPVTGRKVAVPPEFVGYLLKDTNRFAAAAGTNAEGRLISGFVGRAIGFDIFEVNNAPTGKIVAGHSLASTYANQLVKTAAYSMEKRFADGVKGLSVYGAKVLVPSALIVADVSF